MGFLQSSHSIRTKLGTSIAYHSTAMNSDKTREGLSDMDIARIAGFNVRPFSNIKNAARDGTDCIRSNEGNPAAAKSAGRGEEMREEVERLDHILLNSGLHKPGEKYTENNGQEGNDYAEASYFYGRPVEVLLVDETQLFCDTLQGTKEMLKFMDYCIDTDRLLILAILEENARQEKFGHVYELLRRVDRKIPKTSRCKLGDKDHPCGSGATHTMKLWRYDKQKPEMQDIIDDLLRVSWWTKGDVFVEEEHVVGPYFSPVVQIEKDKSTPDAEKKYAYVPVCNSCLREYGLPFKNEFFAVYEAISSGEKPEEIIKNPVLLKAIIERQLKEGWIKRESGLIVPQHYQKGDLGIYSPLAEKEEL
jgi:thymidine kinase